MSEIFQEFSRKNAVKILQIAKISEHAQKPMVFDI